MPFALRSRSERRWMTLKVDGSGAWPLHQHTQQAIVASDHLDQASDSDSACFQYEFDREPAIYDQLSLATTAGMVFRDCFLPSLRRHTVGLGQYDMIDRV